MREEAVREGDWWLCGSTAYIVLAVTYSWDGVRPVVDVGWVGAQSPPRVQQRTMLVSEWRRLTRDGVRLHSPPTRSTRGLEAADVVAELLRRVRPRTKKAETRT